MDESVVEVFRLLVGLLADADTDTAEAMIYRHRTDPVSYRAAQRRAAVNLAADHADRIDRDGGAGSPVPPSLGRWLTARAHLLVRGGASALLQEAEAAADPALRAAAAEMAAGTPLPRRMRQVASTRGTDTATRTVVETGLDVLAVAVAGTGHGQNGVLLYGDGDLDGRLVGAGLAGGWLVTLAPDGQRRAALPIGRPREDNGVLAVSPDGKRVAVRAFRDISVHDLMTGETLTTLNGTEGPSGLSFVDERHLLALDGSVLMLWDLDTGALLTQADTVGTAAPALTADRRHVVVGGCWGLPHVVHELPSLRIVATFGDPPRPYRSRRPDPQVTSAVASSPSGRRVATGGWDNMVTVWDVGPVFDMLGAADPGAGISHAVLRQTPATPHLREATGRHRGWVGAVGFVDDDTVVSAGWDGQVLRWDLAGAGLPTSGVVSRPVFLGQHSSYVQSLAVDRERRTVVTADAVGTVVVRDVDGRAEPPPYQFVHGGTRLPVQVTRSGPTDGQAPDDYAAPDDPELPQFPALGVHVTWRDEHLEPVSRCFRLRDDATGAVLDEMHTHAALVRMAAVDDVTLLALDATGHVTVYCLG